MARRSLHLLVSRCVGLLLLAAAGLKAYGLSADSVARMGIFSTPEFQLAVIEFELFLALWLLSGIRPLGSWMVALTIFIGFAGVSFYQGWIGQSSCGCFGRLSVSP
jgi:Methylamine utilisation protein MauE